MKIQRITGFGLIAIGVFWLGQGLGLIGGSFMTGRPLWAWLGFVVAAIGIASFAYDPRS